MTTISYKTSISPLFKTKTLRRKIKNHIVNLHEDDRVNLFAWMAIISIFIVVSFLIFKSAYIVSINFKIEELGQNIKTLSDTNNNLKSELTNLASLNNTEQMMENSVMELSNKQSYLSLIPVTFAHNINAEANKD